jgi:hypothetical protein
VSARVRARVRVGAVCARACARARLRALCVCALVRMCVRAHTGRARRGGRGPVEIETRSFQMQNKSFVLSPCYAVTADGETSTQPDSIWRRLCRGLYTRGGGPRRRRRRRRTGARVCVCVHSCMCAYVCVHTSMLVYARARACDRNGGGGGGEVGGGVAGVVGQGQQCGLSVSM